MSLVIDIPMPDCCDHCLLSDEGYGCAATGEVMLKRQMETGRSESCPIIAELPAKHGVLIDRDVLSHSVLKWLPRDPCGIEERERPFETDICVSMLMEIEEQPVVVEAEGKS